MYVREVMVACEAMAVCVRCSVRRCGSVGDIVGWCEMLWVGVRCCGGVLDDV